MRSSVTLVRAAIVSLLSLLAACNSYNLLDRLENPDGNDAGAPNNCGNQCRIFVTQNLFTGNLGGIAGADQKCMDDPFRPPGPRTWKAMVVATDVRRACTAEDCPNGTAENIDWVLKPNTHYYRVQDNVFIGTTNAGGVFLFPLNAALGPGSGPVWTGLLNVPRWAITATCAAWIDGSNIASGSYADRSATSVAAIYINTLSCSSNHALYCVEQ